MIGILFALLAATVIYWIIITLGKLLDHIEKLKKKNDNSVAVGNVEDIISQAIQANVDKMTAIDIKALRAKAGKKGMFTAEVKDGVVLKDTVTLIKSDQTDEETEELMKENNGMLYIA